MPQPIARSSRYIPGLDGLRTLAVMAVILYHLGYQSVPGGLLGVGVFFTLSGYLITMNLMGTWHKKGTLDLTTFWVRRFRRLLPAVVILLIVVMFSTIALDRSRVTERWTEALSTLFYVNNWHTIFKERSYFDSLDLSPLGHTWSLSVEEQFYLIWPVILLVMLKYLRKNTMVIIVTLLLATASFLWMLTVAEPVVDNTRAYEGTDTRAGGLLIGAALAFYASYRVKQGVSEFRVSRPTAELLGWGGLAVIILMIVKVKQESFFLYSGGFLILSIATAAMIISIVDSKTLVSRFLSWTPLRWLGERSYGIYLWHLPLIAFLPQSWDKGSLGVALLVLAASMMIAALSWSWVEDPIRRHGLKNSPLLPSCALILVALITVCTPSVLAAPNGEGQSAARKDGGFAGGDMSLSPSELEQGDSGTGSQAEETPSEKSSEAEPAPPASEKDDHNSSKKDDQSSALAQTSCRKVIHVGDSTSIGMFRKEQLPGQDMLFGADAQYRAVGATDVFPSVFGARSTTEGWSGTDQGQYVQYEPAVDSVRRLVDEKQPKDTCWVIATGVNDAANIAAGASLDEEARITTMMDMLKDQKVLWATAVTNRSSGPWDNANMAKFNAVLSDIQKTGKYKNLRIYDWASEARPEWFLIGDDIHCNEDGNVERARRFAAALAAAFPDGKDAVKEGIVRSPS